MAEAREIWDLWAHENQGEYLVTLQLRSSRSRHDKWNFEKFLVDKEGNVVQRWASTTTPEAIDEEVAKLL